MFTTLSIVDAKKKNIKMFRKRKYISQKLTYKGYTFYYTQLFTKRKDNKKSISRFKKRADMPVITDNCGQVLQYEFIVLANTLLSKKHYKSIGIYDKDGLLAFLLPFLAEKCGFICVFTNEPDAYSDAVSEIYLDFGTPVLINDKIKGLLQTEIIFSNKYIPINKTAKVIVPDGKTDICVPYALQLPKECDPFLVCAGLYFYGNFKEFGKIKFKEG